uniref:M23 family peptidase n=1 Tax=Parastrongyloides trichosuri TaxID=131310 RepID=A0A0N5A1Z4_PARTI
MDLFLLSISILLIITALLYYTPLQDIVFNNNKLSKKKSKREVLIDYEHLEPQKKIIPKFQAAKPDRKIKLSDSVPWHPEGKPKKYKIYVHNS